MRVTRRAVFGLAVVAALCLLTTPARAQSSNECTKVEASTDFHAHIFNLRHLPLKGILVSRGVPRGLSSILAAIFEGVTPSLADSADEQRIASASSALRDAPIPMDDQTTEALRDEIIGLLRGAAPDSRAANSTTSLCASNDRDLKRLCRKRRQVDQYYRDYIDKRRFGDNASAIELRQWLQGAAVMSAPAAQRTGFAPATSVDGLLEQADFDWKVLGIVANALAEPESRNRSARGLSVQAASLDIRGAIRFLRILMLREDHIVSTLQSDYCGIENFVAHMVDLEQTYALSRNARKNQPDLNIDQQLAVNQQLIAMYANLSFLGAHDPLQLDPEFSRAKAALSAGAAGLKFYPPAGYRPAETIIPERPRASWCWLPFWQPRTCGLRKQWDGRYKRLAKNRYRDPWAPVLCTGDDPDCVRRLPDAKFLDRTNLSFFKKAADNDWLIFSHHTPVGFESSPGYGELFGDPCHWGAVLQSSDELRKLRLVLAHAGGDGWSQRCSVQTGQCDDSDQGHYARFWRNAYNLCVTFDNVYCDLAYQDAVLTEPGRAALKLNLDELNSRGLEPNHLDSQKLYDGRQDFCSYNGLAPARKSIFDKLMYGTDWMMVAKEKNMQSMPEAFIDVFSGDLEQYRGKFFSENADRALR